VVTIKPLKNFSLKAVLLQKSCIENENTQLILEIDQFGIFEADS